MNKKRTALILALALVLVLAFGCLSGVFAAEADVAGAAESAESKTISAKAVAAAAVVAIVAATGGIGMAISIRKSTESMARQPEASGKINSAMMLGLVFIETTIIYALIVAILIIFVL